MRVDGNSGSVIGYEPNSLGEWQELLDFSEPPLALLGGAQRWNHRDDEDYYSQVGDLFRLMSDQQQQALFNNTAAFVGGASIEVQRKHVENCTMADPEYGAGVAKALGIE